MLKRWRQWCLGLAVALVIAAPIYAAVTSPDFGYCQQHQGQYPTSKSEENKPPAALIATSNPVRNFWQCAGGYTNANGEAITGLATILLTVVTGFLVWLAFDQGRTNRAQLRAYVFVDSVSFEREGEDLILKVTALNSGETPAYKVNVSVELSFGPPEGSPNFYKARPSTLRTTLPRNGKGFTLHTAAVPQGRYQAYLDEINHMWIWGEINYEDAFDGPHVTHFRMVSKGGADYAKEGFVLLDTGNEAT